MKASTQWVVTGVVAVGVLGYLMWRGVKAGPPSWLPKLPPQPNPMQADLGPVHATFPLSGIDLRTYRTHTFTNPAGLMASPSENLTVLASIAPRTGGVFYDTQGNRYFVTTPLV